MKYRPGVFTMIGGAISFTTGLFGHMPVTLMAGFAAICFGAVLFERQQR